MREGRMPGETPAPLLAHPHCGLSRSVRRHAARQTLFRFSRHTVRHLGWHRQAAPRFVEPIATQRIQGAAKDPNWVLPLRRKEAPQQPKRIESARPSRIAGCFPQNCKF